MKKHNPAPTTREERLDALLKRGAAGDTIKIGGELAAQKADMPHGEFLPWLSQFALSERSAQRYIGAFEWAKSANLADLPGFWDKLKLKKGALYFMVDHVRIEVDGKVPPYGQQIIDRARKDWVNESMVREMLGFADDPPVEKEQAVVAATITEREAAEAAEVAAAPKKPEAFVEPVEREDDDDAEHPGIGGDMHISARELSVSERYDQAIATLNDLASQPGNRFDSVTASAINQRTAMNLIRERLGELEKPALAEAA
jgi:hypothetical protein